MDLGTGERLAMGAGTGRVAKPWPQVLLGSVAAMRCVAVSLSQSATSLAVYCRASGLSYLSMTRVARPAT